MAKMHSSFTKGFSESYLADLGRVVVAWSQVEFQFDMLFLSLVVMRGRSSASMSDPHIKVRLMGDRFKDKLAAFRDRTEELDIPVNTRKRVESTLSKLEALRNKRDEVAHSQWSPNLIVGEIVHTSATALFKSWKNQKPHKFSTVPQEQLKKTFQRIEALYWDLHALVLDQGLRDQRPRQPPR